MWNALAIALRFLTIIPIPQNWSAQSDDVNRHGLSLLFYPLVGLIIGLILLMVLTVTGIFSHHLQAIIIVTVWVVITGALHLDGVADSADAWLGGHGDRERTLQILRDTNVGVAAVIAIVLTLVLKTLALAELNTLKTQAVVLAPVIGRTMVMLLLVTTRYVRSEGLGSHLTASLPKRHSITVVIGIFFLVIVVLQLQAVVMLFCVMTGFLGLRHLMMRRLGGTTGDTAGALVELSELLVLLGLALAEREL